MKDLEKENKLFFDFWSFIYGFEPISLWLKFMQKRILNEFNLNKKDLILDVGCANGNMLNFLYSKNIKKLYGIDISDSMIARAEKRLGKRAVLKVASVEKIPFQSNSFDYVLSTEAFHHFPNSQKAVKEMTRILKKGGKLVIADINFYSNFIHWLFKKIEPGHVKIYSEREFRELFHKANLKTVEQKRVGLFIILTIGKK